MKILFISDNFPPESNAPATRTYEHCVEWVKNGAEVTVITCAPNFPIGKVFDGYKNKLWQEEKMDGIRVIRVWSYISSNKGFTKRILDYISFGISGFFASLFIKTDIIIATSPQFFTAVGGYLSSIFKRKKWIMEVRDLWPESIRAVNAMKESWLLDRLESLELFLYRKAAKVIVVTDAFKSNLISRGIPEKKIKVVKNGVNLDKYKVIPKNGILYKKLKLEDKFVIGYLGTHGLAHKLDFILKSATKINHNFHFLFIGDGAEKKNLLKLKETLNLANVTMVPSIPKNEVNDYISITDVALVPLKKSDTFKTVIPSKIFENAAMQKPILLGVEGESKEIIDKYNAGLCFEPENEEDFIEKLHLINNKSGLYEECQKGCAKLAKDFNRKKLAIDLFRIIASEVN
jgi:glycosyltransferase involved in cell wall biosynthesis